MAAAKPKPDELVEEIAAETAYVGDVVETEGAAFVALPDGSVVSTYGSYQFKHAGAHRVDGVEYDVAERAADVVEDVVDE